MDKSTASSQDFSTRRKRRVILASTICILEQISLAETAYRDNMPENLQASDAYDTTDDYISSLEEAIDVLRSVYE